MRSDTISLQKESKWNAFDTSLGKDCLTMTQKTQATEVKTEASGFALSLIASAQQETLN